MDHEDPAVKEILDWLSKIFPDDEVRQHVLQVASYALKTSPPANINDTEDITLASHFSVNDTDTI